MSLPEWYTHTASWAVLLIALAAAGLFALVLLDRFITELFKSLGLYHVLFNAVVEHYRKKHTKETRGAP